MAACSGSVFSETLQTIITAKLEELAKERIGFDDEYASSLLAAANDEKDALKRVNLLTNGTKSCLGLKTDKNDDKNLSERVVISGTRNERLETDIQILDCFLEQAQFDPSVSTKVLENSGEDFVAVYFGPIFKVHLYQSLLEACDGMALFFLAEST